MDCLHVKFYIVCISWQCTSNIYMHFAIIGFFSFHLRTFSPLSLTPLLFAWSLCLSSHLLALFFFFSFDVFLHCSLLLDLNLLHLGYPFLKINPNPKHVYTYWWPIFYNLVASFTMLAPSPFNAVAVTPSRSRLVCTCTCEVSFLHVPDQVLLHEMVTRRLTVFHIDGKFVCNGIVTLVHFI